MIFSIIPSPTGIELPTDTKFAATVLTCAAFFVDFTVCSEITGSLVGCGGSLTGGFSGFGGVSGGSGGFSGSSGSPGVSGGTSGGITGGNSKKYEEFFFFNFSRKKKSEKKF